MLENYGQGIIKYKHPDKDYPALQWYRDKDSYGEESLCCFFPHEQGNYTQAALFIGRCNYIFQGMNHHPDCICVKINGCKFKLRTHSARGITEKDYELAALVSQVFETLQQQGM